MMSLQKLWEELMGSVSAATTMPPDGYPDWLPLTWEQHKSDLREMWGAIQPRLKHDLDKAEMLDRQLTAMIEAYDVGSKRLGSKIAWDIYNSKPEKLR